MVKTKQKYLFRCKECGAEFIFYLDEEQEQDSTNDEKLWCMSCIKQRTLIRVEKVREKKFEYNPDDYR